MACTTNTHCSSNPGFTSTIVATRRALDGELTPVQISGQQLKSKIDFPGEGIYIICHSRALQIAAPHCEARTCSKATICSCKDDAYDTQYSTPTGYNNMSCGAWMAVKQSAEQLKPCSNCLCKWLKLEDAHQLATASGLQMLQVPRILSCTHRLDCFSLAYLDNEPSLDCESNLFESVASDFDVCLEIEPLPPYLVSWMLEMWSDFLRKDSYYPYTTSAKFDDSDNSSDTDMDWYDVDISTQDCLAIPLPVLDGEYDSFDDLIEEEFPKVKIHRAQTPINPLKRIDPDVCDPFDDLIKEELPKVKRHCTQGLRHHESNTTDDDSDDIQQDTPVPAVFPRKCLWFQPAL
ncbi:hypothetical protein BJ170DRAFT_683359 [Xylariales sp. AK1849]|nr:hypothetical protein BJ170DRAFT_683359 [Xylariales sp. AK1849]